MTAANDLPAYLNGRFAPLGQLSVSVLDRGLMLGDGAFETVRIISGRAYLLNDHMERLALTLSDLAIPVDVAPLASICLELLGRAALKDAMLRITVTRGEGGEGYLPVASPLPTILMTIRPLDISSLPLSPVRLHLSRWRKPPPDCLPTRGKTLQGLNATLARMEANTQDETLQLSIGGHIACVSAGNLFWRSKGTIYTPALSTGCLAGTMRRRLMELSDTPVHEIEAPLETLRQAEAVLYTNSRLLARGVAGIDIISTTFPESARWAEEWRQRFENDAFSATSS